MSAKHASKPGMACHGAHKLTQKMNKKQRKKKSNERRLDVMS